MRHYYLLLIGVLAATPLARADEETDRSEARQHYQAGVRAFDLGKFDVAVEEYTAAYMIKDDPALLYNIAQAHRLAGHASDALHFYQVFLEQLPRAPNRSEVEEKIRELKKLVAQEKKTKALQPRKPLLTTPEEEIDARKKREEAAAAAALAAKPAAPPPEEPKPSAPPETPPPPVEQPPPVAKAPEPAPPKPVDTHPGRTKFYAGIGVAAGGLALVVGGIVCGVLAQGAANDLTNIDKNHGTFDPDIEKRGKLDVVLTGVLAGIGGVAMVGGGVLIYLGIREKKAAARAKVSFAPLLSPTGAGALVSGRF